jgi:factor associated with neutral sphingomyelinase activation
VAYYLLRVVPEFLTRNANCVFAPADRFFKSVQVSFESCLHKPGDFRELVPEFYAGNTEFLVNCHEALLDGTMPDRELPAWAKTPQQFCEVMRQALESDYVSTHLHSWIDCIFGELQRGSRASDADNTFTPSAMSVDLSLTGLKARAQAVQIREYGVVPEQLFTDPHPQRAFRRASLLRPYLTAPRVIALQRQIEAVQSEIWRQKKLAKKERAKLERTSRAENPQSGLDSQRHKPRNSSSSLLHSLDQQA